MYFINHSKGREVIILEKCSPKTSFQMTGPHFRSNKGFLRATNKVHDVEPSL